MWMVTPVRLILSESALIRHSVSEVVVSAVRLMQRLSALMRQLTSDVVVSTAAVSLRAMSRFESERRAPFTTAVPCPRSMPSERSHSSPTRPFTLRSLIKPLVLRLARLSESSSMTTRLSNSGRNCTSAVRWPTSASVSPSWMTRKSSMPRSSGHSSRMVPTLMSMPVFSDTTAATLSAAQFCTGGR